MRTLIANLGPFAIMVAVFLLTIWELIAIVSLIAR